MNCVYVGRLGLKLSCEKMDDGSGGPADLSLVIINFMVRGD